MSTRPSPADLTLLSTFISADLSPEDAAELHTRLQKDPSLQRALDAQRSMISDLEQLPLLDAPSALIDAVLNNAVLNNAVLNNAALTSQGAPQTPPLDDARSAADPVPRPAPRASLPWMIAAAATVFAASAALWPTPPTRVDLHDNGADVEGRARLAVADTMVDVDGRARLTPAEGSMKPHLAAGAAGAALTVAVYEGSARLSTPDGRTVQLGAGESTDVPSSYASGTLRAASTSPQLRASASQHIDRSDLPADVVDELKRLQQENARLQLENKLVRGNLASHQGQPLDWPDQLPTALRADAFTASVQQAMVDVPGVDLVNVDCSEYPCLAVVQSDSHDLGWEQAALDPAQAMADGMGDDFDLVAMGRGEDDGDSPVMLLSFSVLPPDADPQALSTRLGFRSEELMSAQADLSRDAQEQ